MQKHDRNRVDAGGAYGAEVAARGGKVERPDAFTASADPLVDLDHPRIE